jgi:anti-sigma factor RsiW
MARVQMLTAEPTELQGIGHSDLARHLAGCERCGRIAAALLVAQRELTLALLPPGTDSAQAARAAWRAAERRRARNRAARWVAPLAVAAGLATVLLNRGSPPSVPESPPLRPEPVSQRLRVTAPPGRSVAVLETENSNVVVIWFY